MQIFLTKPFQKRSINNVSSIEFTGTQLRLYFKETLIDCLSAAAGECYYVEANGESKYPTVTQAQMPESRGAKITWALDFIGDKKVASSFDDFQSRFMELIEEAGNRAVCSMRNGIYAFLLTEKETSKGTKMRPTLAWVSDTISQEDLDDLIGNISRNRRIHCGTEFLKLL